MGRLMKSIIDPNTTLFLNVGHFTHAKGVHRLLSSCSSLRNFNLREGSARVLEGDDASWFLYSDEVERPLQHRPEMHKRMHDDNVLDNFLMLRWTERQQP